jgi:hypothetical protein
VSTACYARIVWVTIPDSESGATSKEHPAVIVTPTAEIQQAKSGSSASPQSTAPEVQVEMPWHSDPRQSRTGLFEPCWAVCTWVHKIQLSDVRRYGGIVPGRRMIQINEILKRLAESATPPSEAPQE